MAKTPAKDSSSTYILDTSREYSIYVCESRAIPKVADGLKDAQRKALWLVRNRSEKTKTVSLAGEMISSGLYLHGDQSAAGAISMLAAPYVNNVPLLDGIGSFGTRVAPVDGIGAPRYTYIRRGKAAQELMFVDMDIVPTKENYDGSTIEPQHFLPLIPTVLLNGVSGIAVGWSTEILPRSFKSLVDATLSILDGKKIKRISPDYELYTVGVKHLEENSWEFTGKLNIVDTSTVKITELPPELTLEKFKERLNTYEDEGKINTYTDRSTDTINITIKLARGACKDWDEARAIEYFKLKQKKSERIVVVDWNGTSIRQYESAEKVVEDFVAWRLGWYETRYQHKLDTDNYELNFWKGVKLCFDDKLPARLGGLNDRKALELEISTICAKLKLDASQITRIVNMPAYRWVKDAYAEVLRKIKELEANIKEYKRILKDPAERKAIYRAEVEALKKVKF
jgi:DNA gyrase/topoisomerase IV subunit A